MWKRKHTFNNFDFFLLEFISSGKFDISLIYLKLKQSFNPSDSLKRKLIKG